MQEWICVFYTIKTNTFILALENAIDEQEQYSRRNCLIIQGLPAKKNENTDTEALSIYAKHLNINISENKLDRSHR